MKISNDFPKSSKYKKYLRLRAQIAIEFLILVMFAFFMTLVLLVASYSISESKKTEQGYFELEDFGNALQREVMLASEMEEGYSRKINVPYSVVGKDYNITIEPLLEYNAYLNINYKNAVLSYVIPSINGSFVKGNNYIKKIDGKLYITN